jgi:hypothetical protein
MCEDHQTRDQSRNNLAVEVLQKTGVLRLSASGYSMLPTLCPGDILTINRESLGAIHPGDIVQYSREGRFFIHRSLRSVLRDSESALLRNILFFADDPELVKMVFRSANEFLGQVPAYRLTFFPDGRVWDLIE